MSIRKGYADTPQGQIHYRQLNAVGGTPLVLFHQTASSGAMFEDLMFRLAGDFHTIAPDSPGFGASFAPPGRFSVGDLSGPIHAALTSLGIERCTAFGHHTGAAIAVQMASDHPGFFEKLVLSGPPLLTDAQISGLRSSLKGSDLEEDGSHIIRVWERIRNRDAGLPTAVVQREVILNQAARDAAQDAYQAVFDQPFADQLASLDLPILVMAGEHDTLRASLEPAYRLLRKGKMQEVAGEGPYICDKNPQAVAEILKQFLEE